MHGLPLCVHAGICAAGSMDDDSVCAKYTKCGLQNILHRLSMGLALPSGKLCAVVRNGHPQSHVWESNQL